MQDEVKDQIALLAQLQTFRDQLANARETVKGVTKENTKLAKDVREANRRYDVLMAMNGATRTAKFTIKPSSKGSESVACVMLGDWHAEEEVLPEKISGMNEYNIGIAAKRIDHVAQNVVTLIKQLRVGTKIDHLIVHLQGDFMTGVIHEELMETNSMSSIRIVLWLQDKIEALLKFWLAETGCKITCVCNVGNHGRTTPKTRIKTRVDNSFEYLLYRWLAKAIPEIHWKIAEGYHEYIEVYNAIWRCHHGDSINYNGGVGGITIPVNKAIAQWDKARRANLDLFGHYHQYKQDTKWLCNGSLIGYGDFSLEIKADYEPPQQTLFLWEKDHGRTITTPIFV